MTSDMIITKVTFETILDNFTNYIILLKKHPRKNKLEIEYVENYYEKLRDELGHMWGEMYDY